MPPKKAAAADPDDPLELAALAIASAYQGKPKSYSFDPALILSLVMTFLAPLLENCLKSRTAEEIAAGAGDLGRDEKAALLLAAWRSVGFFDGMKLYNATLKVAKKATPEEVVACCNAAPARMARARALADGVPAV